MSEVKVFDSIEEMFAYSDQARAQADIQVKPWQAAMAVGMFFVRFDEDAEALIYGEVLDPIKCEEEAGADEDDMKYARDLWAQPHMKYFRFCRCWSVLCEDGELGDVHVSSMDHRLAPEDFEMVRTAGWPVGYLALKTLLTSSLDVADVSS